MDMHIPRALLQVAQTPAPYRVADRPGYFFSEQLSATYEVPSVTKGFVNQMDAPLCQVCGHVTVRNGACYKCLNCGESQGCS